MSIFLQRSFISLACLAALSACGSATDQSVSDSTFVIHSMNSVQSGAQTFQLRGLAFDNINPADDESEYVYKNRESDSTTAVVFNSANDTDTQEEDLEVSAITDINDTYSALSIEDVTVKINGVNYQGDYILIQEKTSGLLYPVATGGNLPLGNTELSDDIYWHSTDRHSNIADQDRIYLNDSTASELFIFELENGVFTYLDTFSYAGNDFWIDENGDILVQVADDTNQLYYYEQGNFESPKSRDTENVLLPFLHDGDFFAARSGNSTIYKSNITASTFSFLIDSTWSNDDDYEPTPNSARRGDFEMSASCALYEFDSSNAIAKEINLVNSFDVENGQLAVAGQDALFCVHADSDDSESAPIITKFDINTEQEAGSFTTSAGTLSDATARLTVISDDEVMFSEASSGTFNEYYVDVVDGSEETIEVTESSIVTLQTL